MIADPSRSPHLARICDADWNTTNHCTPIPRESLSIPGSFGTGATFTTRIVDDETELALSAANRRANDLRDGSGHHGANWVAYLQVSTPDEDGLAHVSGVIEEAADQAGITRLDWLDTLQSAAHATTWPLGRGITPPARSRAMKTLHAVSSGTPKEAL